MKQKKCSKCKVTKNVSEFWIRKSNTTGYNSSCKECSRIIKTTKKCKVCNREFKPYTTLDKFCSTNCRIENQKSKRKFRHTEKTTKSKIGKNNPNYRNGMYCRKNKITAIGEREFRRNSKSLKNKMINDVGYVYCENCKTSNSLRFETHHIIYRSEKPLHENLHKKENLIVLCIKCHNDYHKIKGKRNKLVEQRKLNKLFSNDVLNK